jgi:HAMP domain-containing protein
MPREADWEPRTADPRSSRHLHLADPSFDRAPSQTRHRRSHHGTGHGEHGGASMRSHHAMVAALSPAEIVRRRRLNVLYGLIGTNAVSLFLAFTTGSTSMTWIFALAALALIGYCYLLVQLRMQAQIRRYRDHYRAA